MKIKASQLTDKTLEEIKEINIRKCKAFYQSFPIATRLWLSMKTGLTIEFIKENWEEITH
jgi:hypothetical protein